MNNTRDNDARRQRDLNQALTCAQGTYWDKVSEQNNGENIQILTEHSLL